LEGFSPHNFGDVIPIDRAGVTGIWKCYKHSHSLTEESIVSLKRESVAARFIRQDNALEVIRFGFKRTDKNETRESDSRFAAAFTRRLKD
jgi:hypothetical protein